MNPIAAALLLAASYLLGAAPWGVILGRLFAGTDIRGQGSGSTGTTNAYRVLGAKFSVAVLILDFVKGMLPVLVAGWLGAGDWVVAAAGVAAVVGHCWSPFIGFSGGKGVATGGGAVFALIPWLWFALMVAILLLTKYMSVASLAVSLICAIAAIALSATGESPWPGTAAVIVIVAIIVYRHRANIARLRTGTELKLSRRSKGATARA